ncbi:MFS-type transporter clz9-like [Haliotis rubra]|uniref:MFS-type transporter clz9-like n=1 Tax=Haliotis rubra TaxID=36100 RepID=UPI001EE56ED7|nr:MFS-type transporter clz9-like [Haliotis rubra]
MLRVSSICGIPARRKRQYRSYSPTQLQTAYLEVIEKGVSVYKAAKIHSVPEQTLTDRVKSITSPECLSSGPGPLLSQEEEARLVSHLKLMASVGYGYTRAQVISLGTEYAITLDKRTKQDNNLSLQWFYSFMGRWPELKLRRPRSLTQLRATATSEENVEKYFSQLEEVLDKYQLKSSPEMIYNVDEKGINLTHSAPQVVGSSTEVPIEICPEKSATVTVLGCGNAIGQKIPPFFIFPGTRMRDDLLEGSSVGTSGTVSESGWSNSDIFQRWMVEHFSRYANIGNEKKVLLLYDGHRSHITPTLIDFAVSKGIILFVLPPHTSHVLQPMDVGCFGPFTKIFSAECRKYQRLNSGTVNRYSVCGLACKANELSLSSFNLQSSFRKCGIFPFNPASIDRSFLKPSTYAKEQAEKTSEESHTDLADPDFFDEHLPVVTLKKSQKPRRSIHKIVGGQAITEPAISTQVMEYVNQTKRPSATRAKSSAARNKGQISMGTSTSNRRNLLPGGKNRNQVAHQSPISLILPRNLDHLVMTSCLYPATMTALIQM